MSIQVAMSKSGRCKDVLHLPISRSDHLPSHNPSADTSYETDDADARDEGGSMTVSSTVGSEFIVRSTSGRPPPPCIEEIMDSEEEPATPLVHPSSGRPPPPNVEELLDSEDGPAPPLRKPTLNQAESPMIDCADVRIDLRVLREQSKLIASVLSTLKNQNEELYRRNQKDQKLHDRHDSAVNAILTFLATFYDRLGYNSYASV
jgi:hypothetical protein